jgi:chromosome segregation ATPase
VNWLALILSIIPLQDDAPANRVVAIVIQSQDEPLITGPITDAIARRLDAMQKAWAERESVLQKLMAEIEERQEKRDQERFEFVKQWLENLRPGPAGPVDVGPVREFFNEWKAEREDAKTERAEAAAERAAWREDRVAWRRDAEAATAERKTLLERIAEQRTALMEARTAAIEARAKADEAAAQARAALQQTGPIRQGLQLLINLVWAVISLIVVVAVVAALGYAFSVWRSLRGEL